jgi:hypothetical protein
MDRGFAESQRAIRNWSEYNFSLKSEIEGGTLRAQNEARICGVFGVPPLLVSAYVGLIHVNQRASAELAQKEFWANKMSPTFKRMRSRLTWTLLLDFETEEQVR